MTDHQRKRIRIDLLNRFSAATVSYLDPYATLTLVSFEEAHKITGNGTLICAASNPKAAEVVMVFHRCSVTNYPVEALRSIDSWALVSADGKKAVVGLP